MTENGEGMDNPHGESRNENEVPTPIAYGGGDGQSPAAKAEKRRESPLCPFCTGTTDGNIQAIAAASGRSPTLLAAEVAAGAAAVAEHVEHAEPGAGAGALGEGDAAEGGAVVAVGVGVAFQT